MQRSFTASGRVRRTAVLLLALTGAAALGARTATADDGEPPRAASGGIWKAAVPKRPMSAEFDGFDPVGVAAGARIKADCSLNWVDPDTGKRYCFSSGTSLEMFLDMPHHNIARARAGWRKLSNRRR